MLRYSCVPLALLLAMTSHATPAADADADAVAEHSREVSEWREQRIARLKQPQGWLSLVGLHWIEPGRHRIGSAADSDIQLSVGPVLLGELQVADGVVRFSPADGVATSIDGVAVGGTVELPADSSGKAVRLAFNAGDSVFQVIERGGKLALRVWDAKAATLTGFTGIEQYPIDIAWRFEATFEAHPPGRTIEIASVINTLEPMANPGVIAFVKDGREHRLEVIDEGDGEYFLIFADRTNGRETYGPGRFLYAQKFPDGRVVVDFNRAYNPPCAFNAYSTCPLPPPENRLDLAVTAGEKNYTGPH